MFDNDTNEALQHLEAMQEVPQEEAVEEVQEQQAAPKESDAAYNLRMMREEKERAERERNDLLMQMKEMQSYLMQMQKPPTPPTDEDDDDLDIAPDSYAYGEHLKKLNKKIDKKLKKFEDKYQQYEQKTTSTAIEAALRASYPDFDRVVSTQNLQALSKKYPSVANTLSQSNSLYDKAVSAYTLIKDLGIHQDDLQEAPPERQRVTNPNRPRSAASVQPTKSNLSHAQSFAELTPELEAALYKEMEESRKRY